jgi:hypothetical protein
MKFVKVSGMSSENALKRRSGPALSRRPAAQSRCGIRVDPIIARRIRDRIPPPPFAAAAVLGGVWLAAVAAAALGWRTVVKKANEGSNNSILLKQQRQVAPFNGFARSTVGVYLLSVVSSKCQQPAAKTARADHHQRSDVRENRISSRVDVCSSQQTVANDSCAR